jgi:ubiquinone/menaquinone biosynthesis C-methylase UbiE
MARRTAEACAGFLLPHLRPGMSLLDCGCGPGSITIDIAEVVAPGLVTGIDIELSQVEMARALAIERAVKNARFERANVYKLPFADASFDAVFAHAVLVYLRQPSYALREMRRVLKPGGVVSIVDPDYGARTWSPSMQLFDQFQALFLRVLEHNGSSLNYARHQRRLLLEAGFSQTEAYAISISFGDVEATRISAASGEECSRALMFIKTALEQGWAGEATIEAMRAELRDWGERSDAFNAMLSCAALGWVKNE